MSIRKQILVLATITILIAAPGITLGSTLQQKLSQYQAQYKELTAQQKENAEQKNTVADQVEGLQQSISNLNNQISAKDEEITKNQEDLTELDEKKKELTLEKEERIQALGDILRSNYEIGPVSYLNLLFEANSYSDFLDKIDQITYVYKGYQQVQQQIAELGKELDNQQTQIKQKTAALQIAMQNFQVLKDTTQQSVQKQQVLLSQLSDQEKATLKAKSQTQANIDYVQELIRQEQIDAENAKNKPISGGSSSKISQPVKLSGTVGELISYAEGFTGVPYVWGGTSPSGFDCSGYVQYVFKHFGVNLPRVSQDQYLQGVSVSRSDLKPGDIVFFHTYAPGATHEGIYIGNDTMIDAESRGVLITNIFSSSYWAPRYLGARRIIQ